MIPRYADDDPHHPFDPNLQRILLDGAAWEGRLSTMRSAVTNHLGVVE